MVALIALCTWFAAQPRRRGGVGWASRLIAVVLAVCNPIVLNAVLGGHPEEILGAVLCVGGIVLASRGDGFWAGALIGLAVVNKTWALVAVPVALAVMPADRRRAAIVMVSTAAVVLVPVMLLRSNGFGGASTGTDIGATFNPPQLLWWFGPHSFVAHASRWLIVLAAGMCAVLSWGSGRAERPSRRGAADALALLALVLLLRAALDPWNNLYYHLPFLFALMAYEVRSGRTPLAALGFSLVLFVVVPVHGILHVSYDARAVIYAAVVLPTIVWLAAKQFAPAGVRRKWSAPAPDALRRRVVRDEVAL
jgi:hypothetical protein